MLTELEKKVIASLQEDIAITERPYLGISQALGISEDKFLETLNDLCKRGVVRRFGATLRHQQTGYNANAMVAWQVDEGNIDKVGEKMASFRQVSHCYRRNPTDSWPYNLYTMVHATDENACRQTAGEMAAAAGVENYTLLFSKEELKKTSMVYFPSDEDD
jgi:DNA-binding Lrp family transcriptional regulator